MRNRSAFLVVVASPSPNTSCGTGLKSIITSVAVTGRHLPALMTIGTPAQRQVSAVSLTAA